MSRRDDDRARRDLPERDPSMKVLRPSIRERRPPHGASATRGVPATERHEVDLHHQTGQLAEPAVNGPQDGERDRRGGGDHERPPRRGPGGPDLVPSRSGSADRRSRSMPSTRRL